MPAPLDPEVRAAIEQDIRDGKTRNQIARAHSVAGSTVTRIAQQMDNLDAPAFDRSATENATRARAVDNAASREDLRRLLLEDAHRMRRQLWSACTVHHFGGKDNTHNSIDLDQPTFADQKAIMTSVGIAVDKIVRLDGGGEAEKEAATLIGALVGDIRARRTPPVPDAAQ